MEYRRLGRSGVKVSAVGLGTWLTFAGEPERAEAMVDAAIEAGINLYDTADSDGRGAAEEALGAALARHRRDDLVIATKVWAPTGDGPNERGLSRKHLRAACEASLRRLRVDYLDLYQCHRYDPETTLDETLCALDDLIRAGKVLYWGVCGWTADELRNAVSLADAQRRYGPVAVQARYNLLDRAAVELTGICRQQTLGLLAYSPLAQGVLTGKYHDAVPPGSRLADERSGANLRQRYGAELAGPAVQRLRTLAGERGVTAAQLALSWVVHSGPVTAVLMGATSPEQIRENVHAVTLPLSGDDRLALDHAVSG